MAALLKAAGVQALGVKHNYDPPAIGKHYCSAEIVTHRDIAFLFSAKFRRLSIDQKANLKCNSDHNQHNSAAGRGLFQIVAERVMTYSHGAGGDHLAKFGLFSMLAYAVKIGATPTPLTHTHARTHTHSQRRYIRN